MLPRINIGVQYLRYTSEYILKLQIHQHSLLIRKVFSLHNLSAQVFFPVSTGASSIHLHRQVIFIKSGSSLWWLVYIIESPNRNIGAWHDSITLQILLGINIGVQYIIYTSEYISKLQIHQHSWDLERFGMMDCKLMATPMEVDL